MTHGVSAESKTGVGLNKISLPSGPGSIEGLGDSFEPQLNTGTSSYSVKIAAITDYTPATQGRMMRVDLWINEDPYLPWAAGYFPNPGSPEAAPDADPDGDGATNRQELAAGTNPIDTRIRFASTTSTVEDNGTLLIEASTIPGKRYQLEGSPDLVTFTSIGRRLTATALRSQLSATPGTNHHFFRIKTLPD